MSTFNRGKLLRLARAGKLIAVKSYRFDEYSGTQRDTGEMPVVIREQPNQEYKEGTYYLWESDFKGHGHATLNPDGTVWLYIHSNSNVTLKIIA